MTFRDWVPIIVAIISGIFTLVSHRKQGGHREKSSRNAVGGTRHKQRDEPKRTERIPSEVAERDDSGLQAFLIVKWRRRRDVSLIVFGISVALFLAPRFWQPQLLSSPAGKPAIRVTVVPPYDRTGGPQSATAIAGEALGVDPRYYRVVVYAETTAWYVQPFDYAPFTNIESNGEWHATIHAGTRYAALLVKPTFQPKTEAPSLPGIGGDVAALTIVEGTRR
jgi:hypothetical protein